MLIFSPWELTLESQSNEPQCASQNHSVILLGLSVSALQIIGSIRDSGQLGYLYLDVVLI
jgi:hypothetical protein